MTEKFQAPEGGLPTAVQRALGAWDTTTLKTNGDGMLSEAMEALRAAQPVQKTGADVELAGRATDPVKAPAEGDEALAERLRDAYHSKTRIGHPMWKNLDADRKEPWLAVARAAQANVQPKHKECATFPPHQRCAECTPAGANECDLQALLYALQQGETLSTDQRSAIWTRLQAPARAYRT